MKLWLLRRDEGALPRWDCYFGHVVRADNEADARLLARVKAADEGPSVWLDPAAVTCVHIGDGEGEPGLVLSDFNAG